MAALHDVLRQGRPLEDALEAHLDGLRLPERDRQFARAMAQSACRGLGTIRTALAERMPRGMPPQAGRLEAILVAAAAQMLFLETPAHAVVNTAVALTQADRHARRFAALTNAVLRRLSAERGAILAERDALNTDTPAWLAERWRQAYGQAQARAIATVHAREAALDLTARDGDGAALAARLGGVPLPTGGVRLPPRTAVTALPGFREGGFWVQDAAASLPARLLRAGPGQRILDLCAAPGGKTAQLAALGASVTAIDRSGQRLARLRDNLARLRLSATIVEADAGALPATVTRDGPFDGVLLDAPCSATGTIRRHPDVAWSKRPADLMTLGDLQTRLLDAAAEHVRPGGLLVYAVCSLEPEEGPRQIEAFRGRQEDFEPVPIAPSEIGFLREAITPDGSLRTLPSHHLGVDPDLEGMDGFYACRLRRRS